jgi:hypothetical protein
VDDLEVRAREVLGNHRFDARLAAVIRNVGCEDRPLHALTDDEQGDVDDVLDRVAAGRLDLHMRTDGTFEVRMVSHRAKAAR